MGKGSAARRVPSMRHGGGAVLVDQRPGREAVESEGPGQRMRFVMRDRMGEDMAGPWGRLEPAGAPAAVQVKPFEGEFADDRRGVARDIDDAGPATQHLQSGEDREQL